MNKPHILLVEDDASLLTIMTHYLTKNQYEVLAFSDAEEVCRRMPSLEFEAALLDMNLGHLSGYDVMKSIREHHPLVEVIVMTAYANITDAVQTIKEGALDYLIKPVKETDLILHLSNALKKRGLALENIQLKKKLARFEQSGRLIGESNSMKTLKEIIRNVAASDVGVLIQGESGTGKELIARSIHEQSSRHKGPFVAINCAAIPENLIESELFGFTKGAFTGALTDKDGKFVFAKGGTVFLDEISEMPLSLQAKLLRALQEREITPVGSNQNIPIDIRIISASNKKLELELAKGQFREDLFYRLNIYPINVPPLRDREGDIPLLVRSLAPDLNITEKAMSIMESYNWPGNVRELENGLEFVRINAKGAVVEASHLPSSWKNVSTTIKGPEETPQSVASIDQTHPKGTLAEIEREVIIRTLNQNQGNQSKTALLLGITRSQLIYKMKKLHIAFEKKAR